MAATELQPEADYLPKPRVEHQWLHKLLGEWEWESVAPEGSAEAGETYRGTESVRSLGDLWFMAEGKSQLPDGRVDMSLMTLGYDPAKGHYVGTWIGTMTTQLWVYEGELDASERVLTLRSQGPKLEGEGTTEFKDVIEFLSDDHRTVTGHMLGDDGSWQRLMTTDYYRKT